jgi:hypothetical protein
MSRIMSCIVKSTEYIRIRQSMDSVVTESSVQ